MEPDVIRSPGTPPDRMRPAGPPEIAELFRERYLELVRLAVLVVGDVATAEDVVQDAFEGLYRRWRGLRGRGRELDYVRSAVLNRSRSVLRRRAVARKYAPVLLPAAARVQEDAVFALERRTEFAAAFRGLPRRQREVLALRYYLDLSVPDTARLLRISESAVRSTSSRGLAALARLLGREP